MGKRTTWLACGVVALVSVGVGVAVDRLLDTVFVFTLIGCAVAAVYLVGTFAASAPLFGRVAQARTEAGRFALTFDDGPDPRFTPSISRMLAERGHRATFFVLGLRAVEHPEALRQVVADGHELANHGFDHGLLAFARPSSVRAQLRATEEAVAGATGTPPARLFRAPHGVRSPWLARTARSLGYRICGWNGRIFDTAKPGVSAIVGRATRCLEPGTVLLLHDGDGSGRDDDRSQTVDALPAILDEAERRGLRSVPLSSLLDVLDAQRREFGLRGGTLAENGDRQALPREEEHAEAHAD